MGWDDEFRIRAAGPRDIELLVRHRRGMFADMGLGEDARLDAVMDASRPVLRQALESGRFRAWVVERSDDSSVVASCGVLVNPSLPDPRDLRAERALILNVYTEPGYRRRGAARHLIEEAVAWCRAQGFGWVSLHASGDGRRLYESLGFEPTTEMQLALDPRPAPEERLIVYGTLAPGEPNHDRLGGLRGTWTRGVITGDLEQTGWAAAAGYPAIRWRADGPKVSVWLFVSPDLPSCWPALDEFEGPYYRRRLVPFVGVDGREELGFVYEAADEAPTVREED